MAGNVIIKSASGWIRGKAGRADLQPGTYKPTKITIETDVTAESRQGGFSWKLRSGSLEADISSEGTAERVRTRGGVELERMGGDGRQIMTAGEVDAALDASGKVEGIEARQNARMVFGSDRTLQSDLIWINGTGGIATRDESVLRVGDSTIEGREFTIQQGDIVQFNTQARANLQSGERKRRPTAPKADSTARQTTSSNLSSPAISVSRRAAVRNSSTCTIRKWRYPHNPGWFTRIDRCANAYRGRPDPS